MTPDDVYRVVVEIQATLRVLCWFVGVLCVLEVLHIVAKVVLYRAMIKLLRRVAELLGIVEEHAKLTDTKTERAALAAHTAALEAKAGQQRVATLIDTLTQSAISGDSLPVVPKLTVDELDKREQTPPEKAS